MITPVTDEDIGRIERLIASDRPVAVDIFEAAFGGPVARVIAELRALRAVADAAARLAKHPSIDNFEAIDRALRDAGRLP